MKQNCTKDIARVLSFNIRVGVDSSLTQVASDLYQLNAELSAFQELARHWSLGRSLDQTHYLASAQGHRNHAFMPLLQRAWSSDPYQGGPFHFEPFKFRGGSNETSKLYQDQLGYYGIGVSASGVLKDKGAIYLPFATDEQRGAQVFSWSYGNMSQPLIVLNTHLSVNKSERYTQVKCIVKYLKQTDAPLLILGDLNDSVQSELLHDLQLELGLSNLASEFGLENEFSYSVKNPSCRIDHILGRGLKVHDFGIAKMIRSSDHFPVWADISW